jgi:NADH-quinone oxidoreductase subunit J
MLGDHSSAIGAAMIPSVPLAATGGVPVVILLLCVIAGIATVMLLPSRREVSWRRIGGALLLAVGLIGTALLVRRTIENNTETGLKAYFWIFAAIAIISAMRVITHPRPVYSALYFVLTVMARAG